MQGDRAIQAPASPMIDHFRIPVLQPPHRAQLIESHQLCNLTLYIYFLTAAMRSKRDLAVVLVLPLALALALAPEKLKASSFV